ncbi:MAG TPA: DNA polymerase I [Oligoflexales bacterium]|nr:DNA polymerase I [Oligoflexales bacterium]
MPTLYLVDATGLIHRAFHGIRGLQTRDGRPTNAIYGLTAMMRKFIKEMNPQKVALVFDAPGPTFRDEMFAEYKATRAPTDPALVQQFEPARKIARAMGFPCIEVAGVEADDVIATMAKAAVKEGYKVVIDSADKDLLQLVNKDIVARDTMRDRLYDIQGVIERMGVPPGKVIDFLAMVGDSADNVPGIKGIGQKSALELIATFGGLDEVYANLDQITGRRKALLEEGRQAAYLSKQLVTLKTDVELPVKLEQLQMRAPDFEALIQLLTEFEFRSILAEVKAEMGTGQADLFEQVPVVESKSQVDKPIVEVTTQAGADDFIKALGNTSHIAIAATFGTRNPVNPESLGVGFDLSDKIYVLRPASYNPSLFQSISKQLSSKPFSAAPYKELSQLFAAHNSVMLLPSFEPTIASYLLYSDRSSHTLESVFLSEFDQGLSNAPDGDLSKIAKMAQAVSQLSLKLEPQIKTFGLEKLLLDVEIPLARVLGEMERSGVPVARDVLEQLSMVLGQDVQGLEKDIIVAAGVPFNPNSPKQLADVLFSRLNLPVIKKTKSGPSTDVSVLEELAGMHPVPELILEYRSLAKLKGTYADALAGLVNPDTGRIHTSYNQMVTSTGRLSSSSPNLQNIPIRTEAGRKIRSAFVAAEGTEFISADYSQIELRVLAHLSKDQSLIEAFTQGADIHARTASKIFHVAQELVTADMRRTAKVVNFGLLYGMGAFRLGRDLKIPRGEAERLISDYFNAFPMVKVFLDKTVEDATKQGFVFTETGRRRSASGLVATNKLEQAATKRMVLNMPIQGLAADIIKIAMVRLRQALIDQNLDARIVMQVHDELVLESSTACGDQVAKLLKTTMEGAYSMSVPLVVSVERGSIWSELHG